MHMFRASQSYKPTAQVGRSIKAYRNTAISNLHSRQGKSSKQQAAVLRGPQPCNCSLSPEAVVAFLTGPLHICLVRDAVNHSLELGRQMDGVNWDTLDFRFAKLPSSLLQPFLTSYNNTVAPKTTNPQRPKLVPSTTCEVQPTVRTLPEGSNEVTVEYVSTGGPMDDSTSTSDSDSDSTTSSSTSTTTSCSSTTPRSSSWTEAEQSVFNYDELFPASSALIEDSMQREEVTADGFTQPLVVVEVEETLVLAGAPAPYCIYLSTQGGDVVSIDVFESIPLSPIKVVSSGTKGGCRRSDDTQGDNKETKDCVTCVMGSHSTNNSSSLDCVLAVSKPYWQQSVLESSTECTTATGSKGQATGRGAAVGDELCSAVRRQMFNSWTSAAVCNAKQQLVCCWQSMIQSVRNSFSN